MWVLKSSDKNKADENGEYIKWNPNSTIGGLNKLGTQERPAFIGLGHEMAHIKDVWNGTYDNSTWFYDDENKPVHC